MNIEKLILENFDLVNKVFFETEDGFKFLRVEVNVKDLNEITEYSRKINLFVDQEDNSSDPYYLDIYSSGTEIEIDKNNLQDKIGKNIFVNLQEKIKDKESFEGELLEDNTKNILVKWNAKGQFRKQFIEKDNIKKINLSAKIKKIKKKKRVRNEKRRI